MKYWKDCKDIFNMERIEQVFLSKSYLNILSEVPFTLRINATSADGRTAQDELKYSAGQYSVKISTFLDEFQDGETAKAKYNAWVVYDDELGRCDWYTTWINAQSVQSINQNIAELSAPQFNQIKETSAVTAENTTELVGDLEDVRTRLEKIEECLDDVQTGSINNKVEQLRTLLKSPIGDNSGVYKTLYDKLAHRLTIGSTPPNYTGVGEFWFSVNLGDGADIVKLVFAGRCLIDSDVVFPTSYKVVARNVADRVITGYEDAQLLEWSRSLGGHIFTTGRYVGWFSGTIRVGC